MTPEIQAVYQIPQVLYQHYRLKQNGIAGPVINLLVITKKTESEV